MSVTATLPCLGPPGARQTGSIGGGASEKASAPRVFKVAEVGPRQSGARRMGAGSSFDVPVNVLVVGEAGLVR